MRSSEVGTFMGNIVADPWDDDLRLVFADDLDDHGEPERAALIQTQIELAPQIQPSDTIGRRIQPVRRRSRCRTS